MKLFTKTPRDLELMHCLIAPEQSVTVTVQADEPFRGKWLLLDNPEWWEVLDLRIGVVPQKGRVQTPAVFFADAAKYSIGLAFDVASTGLLLTAVIRNTTSETRNLTGRWRGDALRP